MSVCVYECVCVSVCVCVYVCVGGDYFPVLFYTPEEESERNKRNKHVIQSLLAIANINSHLVRTQSLNVLPLRPGVGQYISHTCYAYYQGFLPCLFLPVRSIRLHLFFKTSLDFSCVSYGSHMVPV